MPIAIHTVLIATVLCPNEHCAEDADRCGLSTPDAAAGSAANCDPTGTLAPCRSLRSRSVLSLALTGRTSLGPTLALPGAPSELESPPQPGSSQTKAGHTPVAATAEPPAKRYATEPLPPAQCDQYEPMEIEPIAHRVRQEAYLVSDRFADSPHSAGLWSAYDLARLGSRQLTWCTQQRELRGRSNLWFLSEDMHNAILAACSGE